MKVPAGRTGEQWVWGGEQTDVGAEAWRGASEQEKAENPAHLCLSARSVLSPASTFTRGAPGPQVFMLSPPIARSPPGSPLIWQKDSQLPLVGLRAAVRVRGRRTPLQLPVWLSG